MDDAFRIREILHLSRSILKSFCHAERAKNGALIR